MKKKYVAPQVETMSMETSGMMAQSAGVNAGGLGMDFGGNASDIFDGPVDADANSNGGWDIW